MKNQLFKNKQSCCKKSKSERGLGTTEVVVSMAAGLLVIGAGAMALRSTDVLLNRVEVKSTLRQNTTNGLRLLRSEVERSMYIMVNGSVASKGSDFNLSDEKYTESLQACSGKEFKPVFGLRMVELTEPVYYGISTSSDGTGYSLLRCGASLSIDGTYNETEEIFMAIVIDDIGMMPCSTKECTDKEKTLKENDIATIISGLDMSFGETAYKTPQRIHREPALRIETDPSYKLVKFIDPNTGSEYNDSINESYLERQSSSRSISVYPLYLAAFARADKRLENYGETGVAIDSAFFPELNSDRVAFLVDGSGSMSACILWGSNYGDKKTYWNGQSYQKTRRSCAMTRMTSLQKELLAVLTDLHHNAPNTEITLTSFSSKGYSNHREWSKSRVEGLVRIGNEDNYLSAKEFVNSLSNGDVRRWGGTAPWDGLDKALEIEDVNAVYFLSDGEPNRDRNGNTWSKKDYASTVSHYIEVNNKRAAPTKVFTTALGLESVWMQMFAQQGGGIYTQIDPDSLKSNNGIGNNAGFCDPSNPSANFDYCNSADDIELTGAGQFRSP